MKCIWCGKKLSEEEINLNFKFGGKFDDFKCCSGVCLDKMNNFSKYAKKNVGWFLGGILVAIIGMIVLNIIYMANAKALVPYGSFAWIGLILGGTLIMFPFCTPQTNHMLGTKKAILVGRVLGIILLIGGIVAGIFTILQFV